MSHSLSVGLGRDLTCLNFAFVVCRKLSDKKTEEVKVFVGTGSIDDGYCWRKYGQKEIHGSSNPR